MTYVVDCSDMSKTTLRRGSPKATTCLSFLYKHKLTVGVCSLVAVLFLLAIVPKSFRGSHPSPHKDKTKGSQDPENVSGFQFEVVETRRTGHGRKAKRMRVVDKTNKNPLSYGQVLELLQSDPEFRDDFFDVLQRGLQSLGDADESAYFFETPPISQQTKYTTKFEFVMVAAKELNDVTADPSTFEQYFEDCVNRVASFKNLGGDALLVAPCRPENYESLDTFAHLANFMRTGSSRQMHDFWIEAGKQMEIRLKEKPTEKIWMSTCGTGIYWLHLRLDTRPKYYTFTPFREA